jgi:hypothetical protein
MLGVTCAFIKRVFLIQAVLTIAFVCYFDVTTSLADIHFIVCLLLSCPFAKDPTAPFSIDTKSTEKLVQATPLDSTDSTDSAASKPLPSPVTMATTTSDAGTKQHRSVPMLLAAFMCVTSVGCLVTAWMWVDVGNGNANFLFFQSLVLYLAGGLLLVEVTKYLRSLSSLG